MTGNFGKGRFFALVLDNLVATLLCLFVAKQLPGFSSPARWGVAFLVYLSYFLVQEGLWARTLGKKAFGLVVYRLDGQRADWRSAMIRSATRIMEANPLLLGALPGALAIMLSPKKQRLGDMWAGTVVISVRDAAEAAR